MAREDEIVLEETKFEILKFDTGENWGEKKKFSRFFSIYQNEISSVMT